VWELGKGTLQVTSSHFLEVILFSQLWYHRNTEDRPQGTQTPRKVRKEYKPPGADTLREQNELVLEGLRNL
jgi:hypothetical protein